MIDYKEIANNLQVIVLESPYDTLYSEEGKQLFSRLMELKIKGYTAIHGRGVMPFDTTDFIATHIIIANKSDPMNNILMSYKSTSFMACKKYNVPFPFLTLLKTSHKECLSEMENILLKCESKGEDLSYDTGWTINPEVRDNKKLQSFLKEIVPCLVVHHHDFYKIPHWVTLGILKIKTDQYFFKMGAREISSHPILKHPYLHNTEARAVIAENHQYSEFTMNMAKEFKFLWDQRITIKALTMEDEEKIAA